MRTAWNTQRDAARAGQRMAAQLMQMEDTVFAVFVDIDLGVSGMVVIEEPVYSNRQLQSLVMEAYDFCTYSVPWEYGDLVRSLSLCAAETAPMVIRSLH